MEGSEIPLGSTTFAACFDARTLKKKSKNLNISQMKPVDIFFSLRHLLPPLENAVMQFDRTKPIESEL